MYLKCWNYLSANYVNRPTLKVNAYTESSFSGVVITH